jgi:fibrillarin-like rRNA methylase
MVLPVIATYSRLLVVVMIGLLALSLDSDHTILFIGVAVGLAVMGLAQMFNVFASPTWNRDIDV